MFSSRSPYPVFALFGLSDMARLSTYIVLLGLIADIHPARGREPVE